MKYQTEIVIDLPRSEVLKLLMDQENMKHWQRGLLAYRHLAGNPGEEGARMELEYQMGKRHMVMVETILKVALPDQWHVSYDTKGVHNIQRNFFKEESETSTRWISESDFQFGSFMMKVMGWLMPGAFKKQSMVYAQDFKNFAEKGTSVSNLS